MIMSSDPFVISSLALNENAKSVFFGKCFMLHVMCEDSAEQVIDDTFESMVEQSYFAIGEQ